MAEIRGFHTRVKREQGVNMRAAGPQEEPQRRPARLVEKGGLGLVMFHLAVRGFEFTPTTENSHRGDLWVQTAERILALEVKTSTKQAWTVRMDQAARVDMFAFVSLPDARCWILSSALVREISGGTGQKAGNQYTITHRMLPAAAERDWAALGEAPIPIGLEPAIAPPGIGRPPSGRVRVVRHTLADGTVREYRYDRGSGARVA